jgi:hypothetical protein
MRLRLPRSLFFEAVADLRRPLHIAFERVGVYYCRFASEYEQGVVVAAEYFPCPDDAYVDGPQAANFDTRWFMRASQDAAAAHAGVFLTHLHDHRGRPWFSRPDMETNRNLVQPISRIDGTLPCGALLLSNDSAAALVASGDNLTGIGRVRIVA